MLRALAWGAIKPILLVSLSLLVLVAYAPNASAAINPQISFQGKLTNSDGTNVANGNYSIRFRLYNDPSLDAANACVANSCKWEETQGTVSVTDGIFQVNLGSSTALPGSVDFNSGSIYLGVKVGADVEMSPRILFTASPYAFNSDKLNGLSSDAFVQLAQGAQIDGSSTNPSIAINKTGGTAKIMDLQRGGTSVFSINNDGSTTIENLADSNSEFSVQDQNGVSLFTIDSLTDRLYVGNPTNDAVGTLLVLDSYNATNDPGGVNGGMYYNSSEHMFRCYRGVNATAADGSWGDCSTQPIERTYSQQEEFFTGGTTTGTIGAMGWNTSTIATAPAYTYNNATPSVTADRPGILRMRTPGTANTGATLSLGTASMVLGASQRVKTAVAFATVGAGTQVLRIGLHNETTSNVRPTTGAWWEYDPAINLNWQYCYYNTVPAAVCTATSVAPVANTFYTFEIRILNTTAGSSAVDYLLNGVRYTTAGGVSVNTTNKVAPAMTCYTTTANARDCFIDYFQITGGSGTLR